MIHATCIGNLGRDAEVKVIASGKIVTNFSLGTRGRGKDSPTTWVRCAMWGERGKKVSEYLTRGARVAVTGTLTTREHEGKTYVELDVAELELLGEKRTPANDDDMPF